jgi:hypothetical protein
LQSRQISQRWNLSAHGESVTTIQQWSRAKRLEAHSPSHEGEDIVCSARQRAAVRKDGHGVATHGEQNSFDYKARLGVSAGMIWGLKKTMFNSLDFGALTISTYAVAH